MTTQPDRAIHIDQGFESYEVRGLIHSNRENNYLLD